MVIRNKTIVNDDWTVLRPGGKDAPESVVVPPGKVIVPLRVWQAQRDALHGWPATSGRKICGMISENSP